MLISCSGYLPLVDNLEYKAPDAFTSHDNLVSLWSIHDCVAVFWGLLVHHCDAQYVPVGRILYGVQ